MTGDLTLRMWPVGDLVVLATTRDEAERALASLRGHPDPAVRRAVADRLIELRGKPAVAA